MTHSNDTITLDVQKAARSAGRIQVLYDLERVLSSFLGSFKLFKRDLDKLGSMTVRTQEQSEQLNYSWELLYNTILIIRQSSEADQDLLRSIDELEEALNHRKYLDAVRLAQRIDSATKRQSAVTAIELKQELVALVETTRHISQRLTS